MACLETAFEFTHRCAGREYLAPLAGKVGALLCAG
jgi:hypothetical protein